MAHKHRSYRCKRAPENKYDAGIVKMQVYNIPLYSTTGEAVNVDGTN
jgi:hypothetical protein